MKTTEDTYQNLILLFLILLAAIVVYQFVYPKIRVAFEKAVTINTEQASVARREK